MPADEDLGVQFAGNIFALAGGGWIWTKFWIKDESGQGG